MQSRYYNPTVGRFVNGDTPEVTMAEMRVLGTNLFAYCNNAPVVSFDVHGNISAQLIARIIIGAMIGLMSQFMCDIIAIWFSNIFGGDLFEEVRLHNSRSCSDDGYCGRNRKKNGARKSDSFIPPQSQTNYYTCSHV